MTRLLKGITPGLTAIYLFLNLLVGKRPTFRGGLRVKGCQSKAIVLFTGEIRSLSQSRALRPTFGHKKTRRVWRRVCEKEHKAAVAAQRRRSLLPRALFVAISLQALSALVLVHLQAAFLFQVAHGKG